MNEVHRNQYELHEGNEEKKSRAKDAKKKLVKINLKTGPDRRTFVPPSAVLRRCLARYLNFEPKSCARRWSCSDYQ